MDNSEELKKFCKQGLELQKSLKDQAVCDFIMGACYIILGQSDQNELLRERVWYLEKRKIFKLRNKQG